MSLGLSGRESKSFFFFFFFFFEKGKHALILPTHSQALRPSDRRSLLWTLKETRSLKMEGVRWVLMAADLQRSTDGCTVGRANPHHAIYHRGTQVAHNYCAHRRPLLTRPQIFPSKSSLLLAVGLPPCDSGVRGGVIGFQTRLWGDVGSSVRGVELGGGHVIKATKW